MMRIEQRAAALAECQRTYVPRRNPPVLPDDFLCHSRDYLAARRRYHNLLIAANMLDPKLVGL